MIASPLEALDVRAREIAAGIPGASVIDGRSMIGGGSLPEESLPSRLVALEARSPNALAGRLRDRRVIARVEAGRVLLDPRTITPEDDEAVAQACRDSLPRV
jgi:L-seryl-tRNA(Ser) seleniumtransferase